MARDLRKSYAKALIKAGEDCPKVVVLDADVSGSTRSGEFGKVFPDRFFNAGIAEADMVAMAGGLAASGYIPFVHSYSVFLTANGLTAARIYGSYSHLPIKIVGAHGGISSAFDGPSHNSLEDLAIMRAQQNFKVFVASDATMAEWMVKHAVEDPSPMFLRMSRETFDDIYPEGTQFEEGKANIVREGKDVTIIACGLLVTNALHAAEELAKDGIDARVVDMFSIKPLDEEMIVKCAAETGAIVTAEEHSIYGGLGGAVCEALCTNGCAVPVEMVGMRSHAECGPYPALQAKYGLDAASVAAAVKKVLAKKK